jgi:Family of unknown function (DUF6502)
LKTTLQSTATPNKSLVVLSAVLVLIRPLIRLMTRNGITYPVFIAELKNVFLDAAYDELNHAGKPSTDSAVSLLSGVHRRDVRNLTRLADTAPPPLRQPISAASQMIARWMSDPVYCDKEDQPLVLPHHGAAPSFDSLASAVNSDVRSKAILDEMLRLGVVEQLEDSVQLLAHGFAPSKGFTELSEQFQNNLHDHAAAASANLHANAGFLEQAVFVDQLSKASAHSLHKTAAIAWKQTFKTVMREAQKRYDFDQLNTEPSKRNFRVRLGVYYYSSDED